MKAESQLILNKYISLPASLQKEVGDFIDFLIARYRNKTERDGALGAVVNKKNKRKSNFGSARGMIVINKDFDEPLEDFRDYM